MNFSIRNIIFCLFTLSSALCRAENVSVKQDFDKMWRKSPKELTIKNDNHTGETDFCTYTCSGGADFGLYSIGGGKSILAINLESSGEQVVTTEIQNLDSLQIYYRPDKVATTMQVSISEDDGAHWTDVTVIDDVGGVKKVKMPRAGDYQVRLKYKTSASYITFIEYIYVDLSGCPNCFLYKP